MACVSATSRDRGTREGRAARAGLGTLRRGVGAAVWEAKTVVARFPSVALPLARVRGHGELPGPGTDIAMDAFVRSGLSYAVAAFRLAQEPRPSTIAHHAHMPGTLTDAVRRGIPALLIVRDPKDAVLSYVIKAPAVSIEAGLRGWARFHRPLLPHLDRIVVATFEQVTTDLGQVIDRLNGRFDTAFRPFVHSRENVARISGEIEADWRSRAREEAERGRGIPRPSEARRDLKRSLEGRYAAAARTRAGRNASALYDRLAVVAGADPAASGGLG